MGQWATAQAPILDDVGGALRPRGEGEEHEKRGPSSTLAATVPCDQKLSQAKNTARLTKTPTTFAVIAASGAVNRNSRPVASPGAAGTGDAERPQKDGKSCGHRRPHLRQYRRGNARDRSRQTIHCRLSFP